MDKICGVYEIKNVITKHTYIGSSKDIEKRVMNHANRYYNGASKSTKLQKAFVEYDIANFVYDVLVICDSHMLSFYEQRFIIALNPEYNLARTVKRVDMADSTKMKLSVYNAGKKKSDAHRNNIANALVGNKNGAGNNNWLGKKRSDETRKRMSESQKRRQERNRLIKLVPQV